MKDMQHGKFRLTMKLSKQCKSKKLISC